VLRFIPPGNGATASETEHPAAALIERIESGPVDALPQPKAPPPEAFRLDGALRLFVDYIVASAIRPQPWLAVGASLAALGALMGRKYRTASNLRSNLYIVGIADSGSGKNHAREVINELFVEARVGHYLGGNEIASGAGLLTAIHRQPAILFQIDEFGIFLGAEYANRDGKNERRDINQPCLCVYGTTTPLHFWNALQSANVVDGSLARFIIVRTDDDYPEENLSAGIRRSPAPLLDAPASMAIVDRITALVPADPNDVRVTYNKNHIAVGTSGQNFLWLHPRKEAAHLFMHLLLEGDDRTEMLSKLEAAGIYSGPRGTHMKLRVNEMELVKHEALISELLKKCEVLSRA
jgi:hypothetical protein